MDWRKMLLQDLKVEGFPCQTRYKSKNIKDSSSKRVRKKGKKGAEEI
jgi:hypothetical protein